LPKAQVCKAGPGSVEYSIPIKRFKLDEFTKDELLEQAKMNAQALSLVAIG
jgi:hypothetical protein